MNLTSHQHIYIYTELRELRSSVSEKKKVNIGSASFRYYRIVIKSL